MYFLRIFFKKFNKPSIQFLRVCTKNAICRKFLRNVFEIFLKKIAKNALFQHFSKIFNKTSIPLLRVLTKNAIFRNLSLENCEKCIILAYLSKNLTNHALILCAFGRQRQFLGHLGKLSKILKNLLRKLRKMHY